MLVVDDDPLIRRALARELHADLEEVEVLTAASHAEALSVVARRAPTHAVVDVHLGDAAPTGLDLCCELRSRLPDLPIVLLTGRSEIATLTGVLDSRTRVEVKPVSAKRLAAFVRGAELETLDGIRVQVVGAFRSRQGLTERQGQVLALRLERRDTAQIAAVLDVAEATVRRTEHEIRVRLGVAELGPVLAGLDEELAAEISRVRWCWKAT